jgi:hypothetical protein
MALVACPDCGKAISTAALACPQCGRPVQSSPSAASPAVPASPPPLPADYRLSPPSHSTVPKWPWIAVLVGGFGGFALGFLATEQKIAADQQTDLVLNVFYAVLLDAVGAAAVAYLVSIVICALKDKPVFTAIGCIAVVMPGVSVWPIVGAIRLAKPHSSWARRYYGEDKMRLAVLRFPKCYTSFRNDSASVIEISRDPPGGSSYLIKPGRNVILLGDLSVIGVVIHTTGRSLHYSPFTFQAQPTSYKGRPKYSYAFTGEHVIYPLGADGLIIREAQGFPVAPRSS